MRETKRAAWSGQLAFVLAAAASAIGLGNLWRFPYLAAKYGGGAFIAVYLALSLTLGCVLLVTEIALGRRARQSQLTCFTALGFRKWAWVGFLATLVPMLIFPYYGVIGGWVVRYFAYYVKLVAGGFLPAGGAAPMLDFNAFVSAPLAPFVCMVIFLFATGTVLIAGVKNGIERANTIMMPMLFILSVALAIYVAFLPGTGEGIRYYLMPNFSRSGNLGKIILGALGQMFFSLSLAMGIMITYGSYVRKENSIPRAAVRICLADTFVAVMAGFMVIPVVYAFAISQGTNPEAAMQAGPGLMFITLPKIFATFGVLGNWVGLIFFTLVLFAALTSSISMGEACVAALCDLSGFKRATATGLFTLYSIVAGAFSAFSYGLLAEVKILGMPILDFTDALVNAAIMPITALAICIFVGWIVKPAFIVTEITREGTEFSFARLYAWMIRYVAPFLIIAILVSEFCRNFGLGGWHI